MRSMILGAAISALSMASLAADGVGSGVDDGLADLGLGGDELGLELGTTTPVEGLAAEEQANPTPEAEKQTRKAVNVGSVVASEEPEELEDIKRGGGGGNRDSKYDFSDIKEPVNKGTDAEPKYAYFSKTYKPGEGTEVDELDRSVKSAATQATRAAREAGTPERYSTRAVVENGVQVGTKVIRVDNTTGIDEAYANRAKKGEKSAAEAA